jgi:hypothetical protein
LSEGGRWWRGLENRAVESPASHRLGCRGSRYIVLSREGDSIVQIKNILDAIKLGEWDFEPESVEDSSFDPTGAMPGTDEKLSVLAARVEAGLPLWNRNDRTEYDDDDPPPASTRRSSASRSTTA